MTPFQYAIEYDSINAIKYLLDNDVNIDSKDDKIYFVIMATLPFILQQKIIISILLGFF